MELSDVVRRRHMVRSFEPRPVDDDVLTRVLAAANRAPAAGNTQALDLLVLRGPIETARYWDTTLAPEKRSTFRWPGLLQAPVLVLPCVRAEAYVERYDEDDKRRTGLGEGRDRWAVPYWHVDGGMATMLLLLAAEDAGLGALFFGIFEHEPAVRETFGIPADVQPLGAIALGHPAGDDEPGRSAARARRPLEEVVHRGRW
jgi:nitroreductase